MMAMTDPLDLDRSGFVKRREAQLLNELTPFEREVVALALRNNPALSIAEALQMLKAFGL